MLAKFSDLEGKTILVTGATRGIGRDLCLNLGEQKAHVLVNYRGSEELAKEVCSEIEKRGGRASAIKFDMTNVEEMSEAIKDYLKENEPITGLVNNAGISKDQIVLRMKEKDVSSIIDTNLKGAIMLTSILSRGFLKAENVSIVNISSIVGLMGNPSQIAYSAAKAGMIGFTKSYAKELASRKIRCNAIAPGFIATDMTDALDEKVKEAYLSQIPLGRFGSVSEVANLTCFLLSQASSYITGEVIKIDGGIYI